MKKIRVHPTQERLRECFLDNGENLVWNVKRQGAKFGEVAGSLSGEGYWQIWFDGKNWKAHRLMWIYRHGEIPSWAEIDHKDGDKLNNKDDNHRISTRAQNARNVERPFNSTGFTGVRFTGYGYQAYIKIDGKQKALGSYRTPEEASAARKAAEQEHHGEFRTRDV